MSSIFTIARLTFREAVRRKIALTALVLGLIFVAVFNVGFHFIISDPYAVPRNMRSLISELYNPIVQAGLYAANFLTIAMAALVSADTLAGEISSGVVQTIASKPLRRAEIVLGKWLGFAGLLLLYLLLMIGGVLLGVWLQANYSPPNILAGMGYIYMEALLIMTITIAASSRLSTLASGGLVFGLFGIAFVGGWVEQIGSLLKNQTAVDIGILTSLIMPSESLWRRAASLTSSPMAQAFGGISPFSVGSVPSPAMIWYSAAYLLVMLGLALRWFSRRDL